MFVEKSGKMGGEKAKNVTFSHFSIINFVSRKIRGNAPLRPQNDVPDALTFSFMLHKLVMSSIVYEGDGRWNGRGERSWVTTNHLLHDVKCVLAISDPQT